MYLFIVVMSKKVLVTIADSTEEIEAISVIDVLRRAGVEVTVASIEADLTVTMSRGVKVTADKKVAECVDAAWDAVVIPGGMPGSTRLSESPEVTAILSAQSKKGGIIAAICAAPAVVLNKHGLLDGCAKATCHPGFYANLGAKGVEDRVVVDGNVITSRGPGTAMEFALTIVRVLCGEEKAKSVAGPMVVFPGMTF